MVAKETALQTDDILLEELRDIVGAENVLSEPEELLVYECDGFTIEKSIPDVVVFPNMSVTLTVDVGDDERVFLVPAHEGERVRFSCIDGDAPLPGHSEDVSDITMSDLCHRYGRGPWVLDDLHLRLQPSTIVHLAGENGAGKSTLAKILVGATAPSAGCIYYDSMINPWRRPGRFAAYHFQNPDTQLFRSSVRGELLAGARVRGRDAKRVDELVNSAMQVFGLAAVLNTHPLELPFSMRKRVAMAATVACGTPWLIMDEPTLGQDDEAADQIARYLRRLSAAGTGVIVISHSQSFVDQLPHQRVVLVQGKAEAQEPDANECQR